jgi:hypothetical protein
MKRRWIAKMLMAGATLALPAESRSNKRDSINVKTDYGRDFKNGDPAFRHGYDQNWREGSEKKRNDCRKHRDPRFWRKKVPRRRQKYKVDGRRGTTPPASGATRPGIGVPARRSPRLAAGRDDDRYGGRHRYDDRYRDDAGREIVLNRSFSTLGADRRGASASRPAPAQPGGTPEIAA